MGSFGVSFPGLDAHAHERTTVNENGRARSETGPSYFQVSRVVDICLASDWQTAAQADFDQVRRLRCWLCRQRMSA
jgi:hypothetical protein